jgi:hypothetical protein
MDTLISSFKELSIIAPGMRTKIGILRSLYPHIKSTKKDGYSYGFILTKLIENGFGKTTPNHFYGLMNRLRLEHGSFISLERPMINNEQITCGIGESALYLGKASDGQVNIISQSRSNPPTIEEMKLASSQFDIDPNAYD